MKPLRDKLYPNVSLPAHPAEKLYMRLELITDVTRFAHWKQIRGQLLDATA